MQVRMMKLRNMRGLLITGTDTNVGKTQVACAIIGDLRAAGYRVGAYKPACSGAIVDAAGFASWGDVEALRMAVGGGCSADEVCPQRFVVPLAPPMAARLEHRIVDAALIDLGLEAWRSKCDVAVIEGVGGLLCPLTDAESVADWAGHTGLPLVIVARTTLGTINHTLLTVEVAQRRGLKIAGIVLNEPIPVPAEDLSAATNANEIAARTDIPVLAVRKHGATGWLSRFGESVQLDWWALAD